MSDNEEIIPKKRRKGVKGVKYKSEIIKECRVKGLNYKNWKDEVVVLTKKGEDCLCTMKCFERVNSTDRDEINDRFYSLNTKNEQDSYLQSLITLHKIARRRPMDGVNPKPKSYSYTYRVSCSSGAYSVCKKAFASIHGISENRIRRLYNLLSQGKSPIDMRGKQRPGNAKSDQVILMVCNHIESFPIKSSHYSNRIVKYLSERLNVKLMHKLFLEKYPDMVNEVKYNFYYKVYKERYGFSFGRPQIDTCVTCEELGVKIKSVRLNDRAKRCAAAEKIVHIRRAKKFFKKLDEVKKTVKNCDDSAAICLDYMQNLELPHIPVQDVFYLRQLTVNVLSMHDLKTGKTNIYVYHEGMAKKGPNEVVSFLNEYVESLPKEITKLYVFSDGCGGQVKNNTVVRYLLSLTDRKRFSEINQFFPVRGHSYLPCDRDFSVIKRKIKTVDRTYTLHEYVEQIITSSDKMNFMVTVPQTEDIYDFKSWWKPFYKKRTISESSRGRHVPKDQKVHFNISNFRHLTYNSQEKGTVYTREFIDCVVEHKFCLSSSVESPSAPPGKAYPSGKVPINVKKMLDLKKIAECLPHDEDIQEFWKEIYEWPTHQGNDENETLQNEDFDD